MERLRQDHAWLCPGHSVRLSWKKRTRDSVQCRNRRFSPHIHMHMHAYAHTHLVMACIWMFLQNFGDFWEWPSHGCVTLYHPTDWFNTILGVRDGFTDKRSPTLVGGSTNQDLDRLERGKEKEGDLSFLSLHLLIFCFQSYKGRILSEF